MNLDRNNEKSIQHKCWDFSLSDKVPFPSIQITIKHPTSQETKTITVKVDTGFNGVLGLPPQFLVDFGLQSEGTTRMITASGEKTIKFFKALFSIPDTPFLNMKGIIIESPRPLIGRTVLNLGTWLYDGQNRKWCLI